MFVAAESRQISLLKHNRSDNQQTKTHFVLFAPWTQISDELELVRSKPNFFLKLRLIVSNCWKKSRLGLLGTCDLIRAPCPCLTGLNFFKFNDHHQIWVLWGSFSMSKGAISKRNTIAKQTSSTFVIIHVLAHCNFVML